MRCPPALDEQAPRFFDRAMDVVATIDKLISEKKLAPEKQTKYFWLAMEARGGLDDPEWTRLGNLALTVVPGSVEAERLFSDMSFIKNSLQLLATAAPQRVPAQLQPALVHSKRGQCVAVQGGGSAVCRDEKVARRRGWCCGGCSCC